MSRSTQRISRRAVAVLLTIGPLHTFGVAAAADGGRVDELKAAYLFNFAKLVEWPATTAADSLTICFVGAQGVHAAFARTVGDKPVGARRIVVKPMLAPAESRAGCDVVYLDAAMAGGSQPIESSVPALTVSDAQDFAAHGGMIELFPEGNRLRFNINLPSAQRAGLRISSSLLQLAARVEKGGER